MLQFLQSHLVLLHHIVTKHLHNLIPNIWSRNRQNTILQIDSNINVETLIILIEIHTAQCKFIHEKIVYSLYISVIYYVLINLLFIGNQILYFVWI